MQRLVGSTPFGRGTWRVTLCLTLSSWHHGLLALSFKKPSDMATSRTPYWQGHQVHHRWPFLATFAHFLLKSILTEDLILTYHISAAATMAFCCITSTKTQQRFSQHWHIHSCISFPILGIEVYLLPNTRCNSPRLYRIVSYYRCKQGCWIIGLGAHLLTRKQLYPMISSSSYYFIRGILLWRQRYHMKDIMSWNTFPRDGWHYLAAKAPTTKRMLGNSPRDNLSWNVCSWCHLN